MSNVTFPVGRMIGGSVYKPQPDLDSFGKPKLAADGTPVTSFNFGVAIPKGTEKHWSETSWGAEVYAVGKAAHAKFCDLPTYAWKIKDGDSTTPNRVGKLLRDSEGCAGCWVIWFKQRWAPKLVTDKGNTPLIEPEGIVPGYFVEVFASVAPNTGPTPGIYLNPVAVNRVAYGDKFAAASVDLSQAKFGTSALPAGASMTPIGGGFTAPYVPEYMVPVTPNAPAPNPAFLVLPPLPVYPQGIPVSPPVPVALAQHVMTDLAKGASYEAMIAAGWNDTLLTQHGMML